MALTFPRPLVARPDRSHVLRRPTAVPIQALLFSMALLGAVCVYVAGALEHAERMNVEKRRGDQSSYIQYAKDLYGNWTGRRPLVAGDRNRMPLYPAYQALFYSPDLSDLAFFELGKRTSIALSLGLLALVYAVARASVPARARLCLAAVAAFTCFVFKAGYFQADLLYYTLHFAAFVAACKLLASKGRRNLIAWAAVFGVAAALSHLTKAGALPLVGLVAGALGGRALFGGRGGRDLVGVAGAAVVLVATFLIVLAPYLTTSNRLFGQYFYNVNSTFYMWYDGWGDAIKGTRAHGDREGWPRLPPEELPGPRRYWREHSLMQIGARIGGGFRQMAVDLWSGYWALKFGVLALLAAAWAIWPARARLGAELRTHAVLCGFVAVYFAVYLTLAAFYAPISGTGVARFALAQYLPLLLAAASVRWHPAFNPPVPSGGPTRATLAEWFLVLTLAVDVPFSILPRLLTTYGGF